MRTWQFIGILAAAAGLAACDGASSGCTPSKDTLCRSIGAEPSSLDPHLAEDVAASDVLRDMYEGLFIETASGDITAGVAESCSASGTRWVCKIRKDARWSNGDPVTAHDFVFSFQRGVNPKTGTKYSDILRPIKNAGQIIEGQMTPDKLGVSALSDHELRIDLEAPTAFMRGLLTHSMTYPVHAASVKLHGKDFIKPENTVTNGAYVLAERKINSHIRLKKNPHYRRKKTVAIENVYHLPVTDPSVSLRMFSERRLDIVSSVPHGREACDQLRTQYGDEFHSATRLGTYFYNINTTKKPFTNRDIRMALSLSVNREQIVDEILGCGQMPAYTWVAPGTSGYKPAKPPYASMSQKEREAKAKELFAKGMKAEGMTGKSLSITLLYNTSEAHKEVAINVTDQWKRVLGIDARLKNLEWKVFLKARRDQKNVDVFRAGWIGDYNDPHTFTEILMSGHGQNDSRYANPKYDALLNKANRTNNRSERRRLIREAEEMMLADAPIIPIYFYQSGRLVDDRLDGYEDNVMGHHPSRYMRVK